MSPLITVLLPVHNGGGYLENAIKSILGQTWTDFELLVLDDGSTDESPAVANSFNDSRLRYIRLRQQGLASALNAGLDLARGTWIARQDADDISHPERLLRQVKFTRDNPDHVLVGTWAKIVDEAGRVIGAHHHPCSNTALQVALYFGNPFVHSAVLFNREVAIKSGGYPTEKDQSPPEDYAMWTRIARAGKLANINEELVIYTQRSGGISQTRAREIKANGIVIAKNHLSRSLDIHLNHQELHLLACYLHGQKIHASGWEWARLLGWPKLLARRGNTLNSEARYLISRQWVKSLLMQLPQQDWLRECNRRIMLASPQQTNNSATKSKQIHTTGTVSVVIATHNRPTQLRRAIQSALNQTFAVAEILICEDGDSEECSSIVSEFEDRRVRHMPGIHSGLPAIPRNRGICASSGEWIAFLDDDDTWHPEKIEVQIKEAKRRGCSFVATRSGGEECQCHGLQATVLSFRQFLQGNPLVTSSVLVQRSLVALGFSTNAVLRGLEDYHLWLQVASSTDCHLIEQPLVQYSSNSHDSIRKHTNTRSGAEELELVLRNFLKQHENTKKLAAGQAIAARIRIASLRLKRYAKASPWR